MLPGLVGLAVSYALSVTSLLGGVVHYGTETEKQMVSVERAGQYIYQLPSEHHGSLLMVGFRFGWVFFCVGSATLLFPFLLSTVSAASMPMTTTTVTDFKL